MTDTAQVCGNCKWFKDYGNVYGECDYPLPEWMRVQFARMYSSAFCGDIIGPAGMTKDDGKDCPTWHAK